MKATIISIKDLERFSKKNHWLRIANGLGTTGYLLPDGTTLIAHYEEISRRVVKIIDASTETINLPIEEPLD
jgi:hypothetical protein